MGMPRAFRRDFHLGSLFALCAVALAVACGSEPSKPAAPSADGGTGSSVGGGGGTGGSSGDTGGTGGTGGASPTGGAGSGTGGSGSGSGGNAAGTGGSTAGGAGNAAGTGGNVAGAGGATGGAAGSGAGTGGSAAGSGGAGTGGAGGAAPDTSVELYDPANLPRFDIDLPQESITALNLVTGSDDPRQDTYVTATLHYGSETVTNIGLRIKGEGSFQKLDKKPAIKLKFDEFVPMQEFHGLRRLVLNNLFEDPSFIAERLAYEVYRAAGIPAPRCNNALVYINGDFYGVYANVEAEDKTFLRRWFEDEDGNLYEEGQVDFVTGAEDDFNLETNETANDRSGLVALIAAVQGATTPTTFLADIGVKLDTAQFLKFTAVEAAVNQWDMYAYTVFYVNNMRFYDDPTSGKFHFIPWGHDMSMKPFRDSGKPFISLFELSRQGDRSNGTVSAGLLFRRCMESPGCVTAYRAAVEEVIDVYESLDLPARAATYRAQIQSAIMMDDRKNVCCSGGPLSNAQAQAGYEEVLDTVQGRVAALRADLDR
jgi:spore coat protein CotH